jgi:LacI family transcriptional regulator
MSSPTPPVAGRPTIRDVARIAGVSIKAVSRVINNQQYVSAATRERIVEVMTEIGFRPSQAARALAGHRSHQIALICDNPNPWYVYEVQLGMRERCSRDGVRMIAQPYDRASPTLLEDVVALIDQVRPDGMVLTPPACDDLRILQELTARKLPFVRVQPGALHEASSSVRIDNEQAAFDMTNHLLGLGHRRIGFLVGDRGYATSGQRLAGYARALAGAGVGLDMELVRQGRFDFESGVDGAVALLDLKAPPTAVFASSDDMAAGVLVAAHRRLIAVPEDLSVVGFDDAPLSRVVWPALTTVRQPVRALAEGATDLLLRDSTGSVLVLPYELVVRESSAPPRAG